MRRAERAAAPPAEPHCWWPRAARAATGGSPSGRLPCAARALRNRAGGGNVY